MRTSTETGTVSFSTVGTWLSRSRVAGRRRRRAARTAQWSEICEQRMLLTAPELTILVDGPDVITGYITTATIPSPEESIYMQVEVDVDDNGTVNTVVETFYDSFEDRYFWAYQVEGGINSPEDTDYAFRPVEWVGSSKTTGDKVVVTISETTNEAPVLQDVWANETAIWGIITDDNMASGGAFTVEVSTSDPADTYQQWGYVDLDGTFYFANPLESSSGTIVLWVRIRETNALDYTLSNAIRVEYTSSGGGGGGGGGESSGGESGGGDGGGETFLMGGGGSISDGLLTHEAQTGNEYPSSEFVSQPDDVDDAEALLSYWLYTADDREWISLF